MSNALIVTSDELPRLKLEWAQAAAAESGGDPDASHVVRRFRNKLRRLYFKRRGRSHEYPLIGNRIDGSTVRRILIVRFDRLGDYVLTTPLIRWLRVALPDAEIDMITSPHNDSIARLDPNLSMTFPIGYQSRIRHPLLLPAVRRARERDYDLLFGLPSRLTNLVMVSMAAAPRAAKIMFLHKERGQIYAPVFRWQVKWNAWLDHAAEAFLKAGPVIVEPVVTPALGEIASYLVLDHDAWRRTEKFLESEELQFPGMNDGLVLGKGWQGQGPQQRHGLPYIVANISAFKTSRQWSQEIAAGVCRGLLAQYPDMRVYVTGAPSAIENVKTVAAMVDNGRCRVLSMKLPEFFGFVAGATLVISPDTATIHIAAAARRPVIGLFADKHAGSEWYPYGSEFTLLISPDESTINMINPGEILGATVDLLKRLNLPTDRR